VVLFTTGDSTCPVPRRWAIERAAGDRIGQGVVEARHVLHAYDAVRDVELVHDHTIFGPMYAERIPDLPVVTTAHGPFNDDLYDLYLHAARRHTLVCVSHHQRATAPDVPVARVIHHGIDASTFPIGDGAGGYALFLGRMAPEKGPKRAIEACRKAGVPLRIVAKMREPLERAYYDAEIEPLLSDDITYLGEVEHSEKVALLAEAMVLVNPIRWAEPFGLVMTEALACGTPVITFPEGAAPEIVDDGRTGFVCADEAAMAECLARVGEIDRAACRAAVEGPFSARRMVEDHVRLYDDVLAGALTR